MTNQNRAQKGKLTAEFKQHMNVVADEVLKQIAKISSAAKAKLAEGTTLSPETLASINTLTGDSVLQKLDRISRAIRESCQMLAEEPAIARVVAEDEHGQRETYYICRASPISGVPNLASYRAQIGRLASLPIGDSLTLRNGTVVEVLERAQLHPFSLPEGWECRNTIVESVDVGPITIKSLRALIREIADEALAEDLLSQLLAEEGVRANIIEGRRRGVIIRMGLRDQPVLDKYQDEIFRLPLDARVLLLGAPGTGKTTTLIRRLGQKLDTEILLEDEPGIAESISTGRAELHTNSWLMFTPTDLLKQYLKEAFAREHVPASDLRIRTWQDYRRDLGRNTFRVLKTAAGGGSFVLKHAIKNLDVATLKRPIQWFEDFDGWQRTAYVQELRKAAKRLSQSEVGEARELEQRLSSSVLTSESERALYSMFASLAAETPRVRALVSGLKEVSDAKIKAAMNLQLNRNRQFLDEFARFIDEIQQADAPSEDDEQNDSDAEDEEEETIELRTGRAAAVSAYMQAVRANARATALKRELNRTSRNGKVIEWLKDRGLSESDRTEVGGSLLLQSSARGFANPVKRYIDGIPRRYRAFRRLRQTEGTWYVRDGVDPRDLHPLELDVVLLSSLRAAADLLSRANVIRDIDDPPWSPLKLVLEKYRNQILVDEATDFSPIQLACMAALAQPRLRSFFACGDFNQRLTSWGARSAADLKWIFPDLDIREVTVSYRHSRQLNELARAIIRAVGGTEQSITLPAHVDNEGVAPVILELATETSHVVDWLAERIREIERFVGQLPSIAIFVNSEPEVGPLADSLNDLLSTDNISVMACREGQAVGQESSVRVFDIQHIKGLEFEAVFFIAADELAIMHPDLFDKYLYVGTTRAATYLGLTCKRTLPDAIKGLRSMFTHDWRNPAAQIGE